MPIDGGVRYGGVSEQGFLDPARGHVLPAGHDHVVHAALDLEQPVVGRGGRGRRCAASPSAAHHRPAHEDLSVVGDAQLHAGQRPRRSPEPAADLRRVSVMP